MEPKVLSSYPTGRCAILFFPADILKLKLFKGVWTKSKNLVLDLRNNNHEEVFSTLMILTGKSNLSLGHYLVIKLLCLFFSKRTSYWSSHSLTVGQCCPPPLRPQDPADGVHGRRHVGLLGPGHVHVSREPGSDDRCQDRAGHARWHVHAGSFYLREKNFLSLFSKCEKNMDFEPMTSCCRKPSSASHRTKFFKAF